MSGSRRDKSYARPCGNVPNRGKIEITTYSQGDIEEVICNSVNCMYECSSQHDIRVRGIDTEIILLRFPEGDGGLIDYF